MPDSSIFLSGSDINTYVGAWVPVSSLTLRREGSQVGSHGHFAPTFTFQARIMPEGLTMVRMSWDEELQEAPQPLSTWYKLPRPTCCPNSTCTPSAGLDGFTGKVGLWPHAILHLCSETHSERNSVLAQLWFCFPCLHLIPPLPRWSVSSVCCGTQRQESFQGKLFSLFLLSTSEELEVLE